MERGSPGGSAHTEDKRHGLVFIASACWVELGVSPYHSTLSALRDRVRIYPFLPQNNLSKKEKGYTWSRKKNSFLKKQRTLITHNRCLYPWGFSPCLPTVPLFDERILFLPRVTASIVVSPNIENCRLGWDPFHTREAPSLVLTDDWLSSKHLSSGTSVQPSIQSS